MSASQSSGSVACLELPLRKPLEEDSVTPLVKWSTSMSTSLLREEVKERTEKQSGRLTPGSRKLSLVKLFLATMTEDTITENS